MQGWRAGRIHWEGPGFVGALAVSLSQPPPNGYLSTCTRLPVGSRVGLLLRPDLESAQHEVTVKTGTRAHTTRNAP